ncbi:Pentatricopeptide repeat, partial [Dillenia turbinata]
MITVLSSKFVECHFGYVRELFERMETKDVFSQTSMVNGSARFGDLDLARKYFDEMPEKNVVSCSVEIVGYSQNNKPDEALALFHDMEEAGLLPTESTLLCVLSACDQSGCLDL